MTNQNTRIVIVGETFGLRLETAKIFIDCG